MCRCALKPFFDKISEKLAYYVGSGQATICDNQVSEKCLSSLNKIPRQGLFISRPL